MPLKDGTETPFKCVSRWVKIKGTMKPHADHRSSLHTHSPKQGRYRQEGGKTCVELHIRKSNQLFDSLDPMPFLDRDLDDDAAAFIVSSVKEHSLGTPMKIVIYISEEEPESIPTPVIRDALHNFFAYQAEMLKRRQSQTLKLGRYALGVGLIILFACLGGALWMGDQHENFVLKILREGLIIIGWVALWRPLDVLLYDWWPQVTDRKYLEKIALMEVSVLTGPR